MIDTHAHVHDRKFDRDRAETVERARQSDVSEIVTVGCDLADSERAIASADEFGLWATVGIHPHEAKDAPANIESAFVPLVAEPRVVAVGETGLDYYYQHSPRDVQQRCLREQIRFAHAHEMPVIFHHRDAFDDFVQILEQEWQAGMRGVVHCFTGDEAQARVYVDNFGLKLGVGGIITFPSAEAIRDAVCAVGLQACVLETDCPYLAPVPYRGKRNEPAFITATASALAQIVQKPLDEVLAITDENARELFAFEASAQRPRGTPS
ncbi:MAG: TatD family hydrolase [Candidatus Eremiobacteraeota bacterium]|nr:TatD family hydrolase [Candidatus Eremiobacteraeota bacterium]